MRSVSGMMVASIFLIGRLAFLREKESCSTVAAEVLAGIGSLEQVAYTYAMVAAGVARDFASFTYRMSMSGSVPVEILALQLAHVGKLVEAASSPNAPKQHKEYIACWYSKEQNCQACKEKGEPHVFGEASLHTTTVPVAIIDVGPFNGNDDGKLRVVVSQPIAVPVLLHAHGRY